MVKITNNQTGQEIPIMGGRTTWHPLDCLAGALLDHEASIDDIQMVYGKDYPSAINVAIMPGELCDWNVSIEKQSMIQVSTIIFEDEAGKQAYESGLCNLEFLNQIK